MAVFILTWNPDLFEIQQADYDEHVRATASGKMVISTWSVGNRRSGISEGDRAFLLRQRRDPGLVAAGFFGPGNVYQDVHWDGSGRDANYADLTWYTWLKVEDRLRIQDLQDLPFEMSWNRIQASGSRVPDSDVGHLEALWNEHLESLGRDSVRHPEEVGVGVLFEGSVTSVNVNRFERNPEARAQCINRWGLDCSVCGFNFAAAYGSLGENFIHVHHLRELSTIRGPYEVDPVRDLQPVCPNCHAMLHRQHPALTIEGLQGLLKSRTRDPGVQDHGSG